MTATVTTSLTLTTNLITIPAQYMTGIAITILIRSVTAMVALISTRFVIAIAIAALMATMMQDLMKLELSYIDILLLVSFLIPLRETEHGFHEGYSSSHKG